MPTIVETAQSEFWRSIAEFGNDPYQLRQHVDECEKWATYLLGCHPEADRETVLLGVWLHDVGHYPVPTKVDHAVRGADHARSFLRSAGCDHALTNQVVHCIRSHRRRDVMPETLEANILACVLIPQAI